MDSKQLDHFITRIEKFDGNNFHLWKFKMQLVLEEKELWDIVIGNECKPEAPTSSTKEQAAGEVSSTPSIVSFQKRERKAMATICLSLADNQLSLVRSATTAKGVWQCLVSNYEVKSLSNKLFLRKKYFTSTMSVGDTMMVHINKMRSLAEQLAAVGAPVTEDDQVATLLCSLPESFNNLITALESRADSLTLEFVIARLLHEERKKSDSVQSSETALYAGNGNQKKTGNNSKSNSNNGTKSNQRKFNINNITCYNCKLKGHFAKDCNKASKANSDNIATNSSTKIGSGLCASASNITTDPVTTDPVSSVKITHTLFLGTANVRCDIDEHLVWYIDSGASQHMSCSSDSMSDYCAFSIPQKIKLGDNRTLDAVGKGSIDLNINVEGCFKLCTLVDVLYVPELKKNLFSVRSIVDKDFTVKFDNVKCTILKNDVIVATGIKVNNMFVLDSDNMHVLNSSTVIGNSDLWHQRYGHLNMDYLKSVHDKKLVYGFDFCGTDKSVCVGCIKGKQCRLPFPKNEANRAETVLGIVHSDVCGPMETTSLGGSRYFVTFIEDKSRFVAVYFIKNKSEVIEKFKEYEALAKNVTGQNVKIFRSDNGGEYISCEFEELLKSKGIMKQRSNAHTPQQCGVAERMNRSLVEMARSMLQFADLPNEFWAEAVQTAAFLKNRSPTVAVKDATPFEIFYNKKPNVSFLKVFGCDAYMHINKANRKKWDSKSIKCVFIGYSLFRKGYRLYDPVNKKIHESRDVIFVENQFSYSKNDCVQKDVSVSTPFYIYDYIDENVDNFQEHTVEHDTSVISDEIPIVEEETSVVEHDTSVTLDGISIVEDTLSDNVAIPVVTNDTSDDVLRRSARDSKPRTDDGFIFGEWWNNVNLNISDCLNNYTEPSSIEEALNSPDKDKWQEALNEEYNSLIKCKTWDLVELPAGRKSIGCRWVFKVKHQADGTIERYKARLVAKGFSQRPDIDYGETFSPVARYATIRLIMSIANQLELELVHMDVQTAFLNGSIKEEVYMDQPAGFTVKSKKVLVCKLNRSLYGLKQASRCWNETFTNFLLNNGYKQSKSDTCLYIKNDGDSFIIIVLFVDDLLIACNCLKLLNNEKDILKKQFCMKDLGDVKHLLGIQIERDRINKKLFLHQSVYLNNLLSKYGMSDCKPVETPQVLGSHLVPNEGSPVDIKKFQAIVGSITYAVICTRPDLAAALNVISQYCSNPGFIHWQFLKRILRYIKHTVNFGIEFNGCIENSIELLGYVDADWGGSIDGRKSRSGYIFKICGGIISWISKKQTTVALSSTEAEYLAASLAVQECVWLRSVLFDLNFTQSQPSVIFEDNQSTISLSKNAKFHARTKHIDVKHHFIRDKFENNEIILKYCSSNMMLADILTKPLSKPLFQKFCDLMNIKPSSISI